MLLVHYRINMEALPCVLTELIFRFDDDKDTSALYEELWEDIPSSERVTLTLYLPETVSLLCNCMSSSSWAGKRKVRSLFHNFLSICISD
jgi:hypothetical protein